MSHLSTVLAVISLTCVMVTFLVYTGRGDHFIVPCSCLFLVFLDIFCLNSNGLVWMFDWHLGFWPLPAFICLVTLLHRTCSSCDVCIWVLVFLGSWWFDYINSLCFTWIAMSAWGRNNWMSHVYCENRFYMQLVFHLILLYFYLGILHVLVITDDGSELRSTDTCPAVFCIFFQFQFKL